MPHDVFISHSTDDKLVALALCNKLESVGVRCWIAPRDVGPGAEWGKAIVDAISSCRLMVLVFSAKANESRHIRREVQTAFEKDLVVIPFRVENTLPTGTMEYYLTSVHWLDALTPPVENHLMGVVERVKALLPAAVQAPASPSQEAQPVEITPSEPKKVSQSAITAPPTPTTFATGDRVTEMTSSSAPAPSTIHEKSSSSVSQKGTGAKRLKILASLALVVLLAIVGYFVLRPKPNIRKYSNYTTPFAPKTSPSPDGVFRVSDNEAVTYKGAATQADARKVAECLKTLGWFDGTPRTVNLYKDGSNTTVTFFWSPRLLDDDTINTFRLTGERLADTATGHPLAIQLYDFRNVKLLREINIK